MTNLIIRLRGAFVTQELNELEMNFFRNSAIDKVGLRIFPVNAITNFKLSFYIPFSNNSVVKKISSFDGNICEKTRKYNLYIDGNMKVKIRPGVVERLNEEEGGFLFKLACITCVNEEGSEVKVALDGQEGLGEYGVGEDGVDLADWYTISDFSFV